MVDKPRITPQAIRGSSQEVPTLQQGQVDVNFRAVPTVAPTGLEAQARAFASKAQDAKETQRQFFLQTEKAIEDIQERQVLSAEKDFTAATLSAEQAVIEYQDSVGLEGLPTLVEDSQRIYDEQMKALLKGRDYSGFQNEYIAGKASTHSAQVARTSMKAKMVLQDDVDSITAAETMRNVDLAVAQNPDSLDTNADGIEAALIAAGKSPIQAASMSATHKRQLAFTAFNATLARPNGPQLAKKNLEVGAYNEYISGEDLVKMGNIVESHAKVADAQTLDEAQEEIALIEAGRPSDFDFVAAAAGASTPEARERLEDLSLINDALANSQTISMKERAERIENLEKDLVNPKAEDRLVKQRVQTSLKKMQVAQADEFAKGNHVGWYQQTGQIDSGFLDLTDPDAVSLRRRQLEVLSQEDGVTGAPILSTTEASGIAKTYKEATRGDRLAIVTSMSGLSDKEFDRVIGMMPDDTVFPVSAALARSSSPIEQGLHQEIEAGLDILADDSIPRPDADKLADEIRSKMGARWDTLISQPGVADKVMNGLTALTMNRLYGPGGSNPRSTAEANTAILNDPHFSSSLVEQVIEDLVGPEIEYRGDAEVGRQTGFGNLPTGFSKRQDPYFSNLNSTLSFRRKDGDNSWVDRNDFKDLMAGLTEESLIEAGGGLPEFWAKDDAQGEPLYVKIPTNRIKRLGLQAVGGGKDIIKNPDTNREAVLVETINGETVTRPYILDMREVMRVQGDPSVPKRTK